MCHTKTCFSISLEAKYLVSDAVTALSTADVDLLILYLLRNLKKNVGIDKEIMHFEI
jgi:hypothetical protein